MIRAYIDYRDFKIPPWDRGANRKDIPDFWLRVLRNFKRMEQEAEQYHMNKQRMENDETYQRYLAQEQKKQAPQQRLQQHQQQRQARIMRGSSPAAGTMTSEQRAKEYMKWRAEQIKLQRKQQADKHERLQQQQRQKRNRNRRR